MKKKCLHFPCSYYLEVLHQDYGGPGSFKIAFFKGESSYTKTQTDDAVDEEQNIVAEYDLFDEEQVRIHPVYELGSWFKVYVVIVQTWSVYSNPSFIVYSHLHAEVHIYKIFIII